MTDENGGYEKRRRERAGARDDFWTIETMMPPKRQTAFARNTDPVEIEINPTEDPTPDDEERRINSAIPPRDENPDRGGVCEYEYQPQNPLIKKVTVRPWPSRYTFYNKYRDDAERFYSRTHEACEPAPFFSYMPQFNQLSRRQLSWYLYWRDRVRGGEYPETDYAYIVMLINEIVNLPDKYDPSVGIVLMTGLWRAYRLKYTKLDALMTETVCDYCLINRLPAPFRLMGREITSSALKIARFKEFYARDSSENTYTNFLISQASGYDYNASRYITAENHELFDRHIKGVIELLTERKVFDPENESPAIQRYSRDSFANILCCCDCHKRIDIEYCSYRTTQKLRTLTTSVIKYSENCVRKLIGVNAKYKVTDLEENTAALIDGYFEPFIPKKPEKKAKKRENEAPEYEKLYDVESETLSPENAMDIERSSWQATSILTEAFDGQTDEESEQTIEEEPEYKPEIAENDGAGDTGGLEAEAREVLSLMLGGRSLEEYAKSRSVMPGAMADRVNEALYPVIGDIALQTDSAGKYTIIGDYLSDVKDFIDKGAAGE